MIFLKMTDGTGMETIRKIVSANSDALVALDHECAVPIRLGDAQKIVELYESADPSHQAKLDKLPFMAIMEIYMLAVASGIASILTGQSVSTELAQKRNTWH